MKHFISNTWRLCAIGVLVFLYVSQAKAATAVLVSEQVTGSTKQCIYTYVGRQYVITVDYIGICPYQIRVPDMF